MKGLGRWLVALGALAPLGCGASAALGHGETCLPDPGRSTCWALSPAPRPAAVTTVIDVEPCTAHLSAASGGWAAQCTAAPLVVTAPAGASWRELPGDAAALEQLREALLYETSRRALQLAEARAALTRRGDVQVASCLGERLLRIRALRRLVVDAGERLDADALGALWPDVEAVTLDGCACACDVPHMDTVRTAGRDG